jgi:hypothetical protein
VVLERLSQPGSLLASEKDVVRGFMMSLVFFDMNFGCVKFCLFRYVERMVESSLERNPGPFYAPRAARELRGYQHFRLLNNMYLEFE